VKDGRRAETLECPYRYPVRLPAVHDSGGTVGSLRRTYLCKLRYGFMVKMWRCVGMGRDECPKNREVSIKAHEEA